MEGFCQLDNDPNLELAGVELFVVDGRGPVGVGAACRVVEAEQHWSGGWCRCWC